MVVNNARSRPALSLTCCGAQTAAKDHACPSTLPPSSTRSKLPQQRVVVATPNNASKRNAPSTTSPEYHHLLQQAFVSCSRAACLLRKLVGPWLCVLRRSSCRLRDGKRCFCRGLDRRASEMDVGIDGGIRCGFEVQLQRVLATAIDAREPFGCCNDSRLILGVG